MNQVKRIPGCKSICWEDDHGHYTLVVEILDQNNDIGQRPAEERDLNALGYLSSERTAYWCPGCGINPRVDEDGLCGSCGATVGKVPACVGCDRSKQELLTELSVYQNQVNEEALLRNDNEVLRQNLLAIKALSDRQLDSLLKAERSVYTRDFADAEIALARHVRDLHQLVTNATSGPSLGAPDAGSDSGAQTPREAETHAVMASNSPSDGTRATLIVGTSVDSLVGDEEIRQPLRPINVFGAPLSEDYLVKARERIEGISAATTIAQRMHAVTKAVVNIIDHLEKERAKW